MVYRVLRLMEYEYPNVEAFEADSKRWGVPATGCVQFGNGPTMRSSIIPYSDRIDAVPTDNRVFYGPSSNT